jgi:hypothetical protein
MKDYCEQTIQHLGKQPPGVVLAITMFFALGGALLTIFTGSASTWGMWIPLCFLVVPPVHYLCREVLRMRERIAELERKLQ